VLIIDKNHLSRVEKILNNMNEKYYLIGQVVKKKGNRKIIIK